MTNHLAALTFDCGDAARLAAFWSGVLDRPVDDGGSEDFATIGMATGRRTPAWFFIKVPEGASAKNRFHPDLMTSGDLATEVARLEGIGATRHGEFNEGGHHWITFTDPEGNVFDVVQGH